MHCVIFAAMPVTQAMEPYYNDADVTIAADAGYRVMQQLKLLPDILLGDYDSAPIPADDKHVECLPREKDDTDTYYAARRALALGADRVTILGGLGGRLDHTLANLHTVAFLARSGVSARLADENTEIDALLPGSYRFARRDGYVSLFPAGDSIEGVTLRGFHYPLTDATLTNSYPLGISNEFVADVGEISFTHGVLYLVFVREQ
ncbi:MAG: thiamine diphosphokinase [Ruthenibacterium sp.]